MMQRVKRIVFVGLLSLLWLAPTQAMAGPIWYTAKVTSVGVTSDGRVSLLMTDEGPTPAFARRWFIVPASAPVKKEILAVALTASSMNSQVFVFVDGEVQFGEVLHLYACSDIC